MKSTNDTSVKELLGLLASDNAAIRRKAATMLAEQAASNKAVQRAFIKRIGSGTDNVVMRILIRTLSGLLSEDGSQDNDHARTTLLNIAASDERDEELRTMALDAVTVTGTERDSRLASVADDLVSSHDTPLSVRVAAIRPLSFFAAQDNKEHGKPARKLLFERLKYDADDRLRVAILQSIAPLAAQDSDIRDYFVDVIRNTDEDADLRAAAIEALAPSGSEDAYVRWAIEEQLQDEFSRVRKTAIRACGHWAGTRPRTRHALLGLIENEEDDIRAAAITSLAPHVDRYPDIREAFRRQLKHEDDPDIASALTEILYETQDDSSCLGE